MLRGRVFGLSSLEEQRCALDRLNAAFLLADSGTTEWDRIRIAKEFPTVGLLFLEKLPRHVWAEIEALAALEVLAR